MKTCAQICQMLSKFAQKRIANVSMNIKKCHNVSKLIENPKRTSQNRSEIIKKWPLKNQLKPTVQMCKQR